VTILGVPVTSPIWVLLVMVSIGLVRFRIILTAYMVSRSHLVCTALWSHRVGQHIQCAAKNLTIILTAI